MKKDFWKDVADWYCVIVAMVVTFYALAFVIFGGRIHVEIFWNSFDELIKRL